MRLGSRPKAFVRRGCSGSVSPVVGHLSSPSLPFVLDLKYAQTLQEPWESLVVVGGRRSTLKYPEGSVGTGVLVRFSAGRSGALASSWGCFRNVHKIIAAPLAE